MTLSIYPTQVRADSTILPIVESDTVGLPESVIQIHDWQYLPYPDAPLTFIPLNRTYRQVPVILKELTTPTITKDSGIVAGTGYSLVRSSGEGNNGGYTATSINSDYS